MIPRFRCHQGDGSGFSRPSVDDAGGFHRFQMKVYRRWGFYMHRLCDLSDRRGIPSLLGEGEDIVVDLILFGGQPVLQGHPLLSHRGRFAIPLFTSSLGRAVPVYHSIGKITNTCSNFFSHFPLTIKKHLITIISTLIISPQTI